MLTKSLKHQYDPVYKFGNLHARLMTTHNLIFVPTFRMLHVAEMSDKINN